MQSSSPHAHSLNTDLQDAPLDLRRRADAQQDTHSYSGTSFGARARRRLRACLFAIEKLARDGLGQAPARSFRMRGPMVPVVGFAARAALGPLDAARRPRAWSAEAMPMREPSFCCNPQRCNTHGALMAVGVPA